MPPLVIPQGVLVRLIWTKAGTPYAVNVLGALNPGAATINQAFANTLGAAIKAAVASSGLDDSLDDGVALGSVGVRSIAVGNLVEFTDAGAPVPGVDAVGDLLPPQVAVCITLRTALAGKSFRGRVYLTGFTTAALDAAGTVVSASSTACVNFVTAIQSAMAASGLTMAVLSRKNLTGQAVTGIQARDLVFDTIRNRATPGI